MGELKRYQLVLRGATGILEMTQHESGSFVHFAEVQDKLGDLETDLNLERTFSEQRNRTIGELGEEIEARKRQLPEGMENCTIRFIECPIGHGRLTATNWIDHGCPTCSLAAVTAERDELLKLCREMEDWLRPELTSEPARAFFWKLIAIVKKCDIRQALAQGVSK